jgi:(p)ppGpp synthase/HD superfamily hydrolase
VHIAQTNIQLYNQLREKGLPLDDLITVHRAYELCTELYSGRFQADGKPFVAHGVGVASVLAELDQSSELLSVGLLHNVYGNGDFGDGRLSVVTASRRRLVRDAVGSRIERLVARFSDVRVEPQTIGELRRTLPERNEDDRRLIVIDLVDTLEKFQDLGVLYYGENDWVLSFCDGCGDDLVHLASELGEPRLAELLSSSFATITARRDDVPLQLRPSDLRAHSKLIVPRSCARRVRPRLRARMAALRRRLRIRTRLRQLLSTPRAPGRGSA